MLQEAHSMTTLTNTPTLGDLLKYELNGSYSRETDHAEVRHQLCDRLGARKDHGIGQVSPLARGCRDW